MKPHLSRGSRGAPGVLASLLLLGLSFPVSAARGQEPAAPEAAKSTASRPEIRIIARNKEMTKDRLIATGDVEIQYGEFRLFADRVEFDPETRDVVAQGNVVIQVRDEVTRSERAFLNLDTERGRLEKTAGMLQPSIYFSAESIERETADLYSLSRARVTSCAQPVPRWSFSFSRANMKKDDYIEMWSPVLSVKKVPIFYLPYLRYPLRDRATGFLMPNLGYSGAKGFLYSQSFYWAVTRNMDATVGLDWYPSTGLGTGLEYRYLLPAGSGGQVNLYYFMFKRDASGLRPEPGSIIRVTHNQALPMGFTLAANIDYQKSFDFLREFDQNFRQASVSNRSSQVFLSRSWRQFNVSAQVSRFETYFSDLNDSVVSTTLPQINVNVFRVKLLSPLYFSLTGGYTNWRYGFQSEYTAGTERRSSNLTMRPTLSLPFSSIPWLTVNTSLGANLVYYGQSLDPETHQIVKSPLLTGNAVVNVDVVGPVFYRIFNNETGAPRLKNIIEPYFNYTYESPVGQADRIVTPYGFFRLHQIAYGFTSRFLQKKEERQVEVLSFGLGQIYYFSPATGPLGQYLVNGLPPRWSEVSGTLRYYPRESFSLDAAIGYNPYYHNLSTLRLTSTAGLRADGRFLSLNWYRSMNSWATGMDPALSALYNRHQVGAVAGWRFPAISLDVLGEIDYNLQQKKLLYTASQVVYHYQCLDFLFEARVYYYRLRPETQIRFSVGLGNIGRTGDLLSGLGF